MPIFCRNLQDAVGVDEKFHFDARQAGGGRRNFQGEASERTAISREFTFALKDMDVDAGLVVNTGGVKLLGAGGDGGIAGNNFCDRAAVGLDAERKRRDVEQEHGLDALVEDVGLDGCAERDDFVGIQSGVRVAPPTRTTSSISAGLSWASARACLRGAMVRSTTGWIRASSAPRVNS